MSRKRTNYKGSKKSKPFRNGRDEDARRGAPSEQTEGDRPHSGGSGENDISWYTRYPNLVVASASLPYPYRPGMDVEIATTRALGGGTWVNTVKQKIPGVMALEWIPSAGKSENAMDPASLLGMEIYARVRQAYSGTLRADAPDYVIYIMALDSVFSYIAWLKRLYRVLNAWTPENYAMPAALLHGMGLQDDDIAVLRANRMQLWEYINMLVLESRKFTCPGTLDIINRHYWMSDNVYVDDPSLNSQMYMFNLAGAYEYSLATYGDGTTPVGGLTMKFMPWVRSSTTANPNGVGPTLSVQLLYDYGHSMLTALAEWDDSYTINGYLKRAYEGTPLFIVEEIPINAVLDPVYSTEVLTQIENSRSVIFGENLNYEYMNFNIWQDPTTNAIISKPNIHITDVAITSIDPWLSSCFAESNPFLSARSNNPNPLENIVMTRLHAMTDITYAETSTAAKVDVTADIDVGTEIPLTWVIVEGGSSSNYSSSKVKSMVDNVKNDAYHPYCGSVSMSTLVNIIAGASNFDWHPFMIISTPGKDVDAGCVFGDIHNVTTITKDMLRNMHEKCIYSEFNSFSMS